ncbi:MAG: septation protein IspZ [Sphingobium sp.]|nr:MAG: septation protein IspZ [Sphingobium sp.]
MSPPDTGLRIWSYRCKFEVDGLPCQLDFRSGFKGSLSLLSIAGIEHGWDNTPVQGPEAARNHKIRAQLPSGKQIEVEAGCFNWWSIAIAVRVDGELVHESHPGQKIEMPERARKMLVSESGDGEQDPAYDLDKLKANRIPIGVDIILGLLFFVIGKYVGLTEAALFGAAAGITLMIVQRITKIDLLGGLASFGIIMLLLSAGFAWFFQDDQWVKQRSTIVGLIGATAFVTDGLLGGKWLGKGLSRYVAYSDIIPARLSLAMGVVGVVMAALNWMVARTFSTDIWLFYTTFLDFLLVFLMALVAVQWSRGRKLI